MKQISAKVELWAQGQDDESHIARCARVCYASQATGTDTALIQSLVNRKHLSMFRHSTYYFYLPKGHKMSAGIILYLQSNPYCGCVRITSRKRKDKDIASPVFLALNGQFVLELERLCHRLSEYSVSEAYYIRMAKELPTAWRQAVLMTVRVTVCCTTQISTSRELNRKSPNAIAEQSTRYVNFNKHGGQICICEPEGFRRLPRKHQWAMRLAWWVAEKSYLYLTRHGMQPQHARGVLPLETATKVVYTYSCKEWHDIFDLRLRGTTGAPHPDAKELCQLILIEMKAFIPFLAEGIIDV